MKEKSKTEYIKVKPATLDTCHVYREGHDFTYNKETGNIDWIGGGSLPAKYAKPATRKEYLDYRKNIKRNTNN